MIRSVIFVCVVLVASLVGMPTASAHEESCFGIGTVLTPCTAGSHVRGGEFIQHGPDMEMSAQYTGTIVSYLQSSSGNVKYTCDIILGQRDWCRTDFFSTWPEVGEEFSHVCYSYHLRTENRGGIGPYGCFVKHD